MESFVYDELCKREADDWWFVGRRKIIEILLDKLLKKRKNLSILDIGCGSGDMVNLLQKYGQVVGIDNDKKIIKYNLNKKRNVLLGNINKLTFPDNHFDLITVLEVFEHLENDEKGFKEVLRVLKPKGILVLTVPAFHFLWGSHDVVAHHKRRYTRGELKNKLLANGFKEIKVTYMNTFLFPLVLFARLFTNKLGVRKGKSDFYNYPPIVNYILRQIFCFESRFIDKISLPVGVSLLAIVKK